MNASSYIGGRAWRESPEAGSIGLAAEAGWRFPIFEPAPHVPAIARDFDFAAFRPGREREPVGGERASRSTGRWGFAFSVGAHALVLATLLFWAPTVEAPPPEPIAIEMVVDAPPIAEPEPKVPEVPPPAAPDPVAAAPPPPALEPLQGIAPSPPPADEAPPADAPQPIAEDAPPPVVAPPSPLPALIGPALEPPQGIAPSPLPANEAPAAPPAEAPQPIAENAPPPVVAPPSPPTVKTPPPAIVEAAPPRRVAPALPPRPAPSPVRAETRPASKLPDRAPARAPTPADKPSSVARVVTEAPRRPVAPPASKPEPAASSDEVSAYQGAVLSQIAGQKRYPEAARERAPKGVAVVRFSLGVSGQLIEASLARSAGDAILDAEALATVRRASPFPPPPAGASRTFTTSLSFKVR